MAREFSSRSSTYVPPRRRARGSCVRPSPRVLIVALPLVAAAALVYLFYYRSFLSHRTFTRTSRWRPKDVAAPAPSPPPDDNNEAVPQVPEFGLASDLHRAAAAACLNLPGCMLGVVLADSSADATDDVSIVVSEGKRSIPVVVYNHADEWAVAGGPRLVTCPSPDAAHWLVFGTARWKVAESALPAVKARCAPAGPSWVSCDWLQSRTKSLNEWTASPGPCDFPPGSVVAATTGLDAHVLPLLRAGAYALLLGTPPGPGFVSKARIHHVQDIAALPAPGDGVRHRAGVWVATTNSGGDSVAILPALDEAAVQASYIALREHEAFSTPQRMPPVLSFVPCTEWPARTSDAPCGVKPFTVFDYLLALRNALSLAYWHRMRLVPPTMMPETDGAHHDHATASDAKSATQAWQLVDLTATAEALRGTAPLIDVSVYSVRKLGWSVVPERVGAARAGDGGGAHYGGTGGDLSAVEAELHALLKRYTWTAQKLEVAPCPIGVIAWSPRVFWQTPLWRRLTASITLSQRIQALAASAVVALRARGRPARDGTAAGSYFALDLTNWHVNQRRCRCLLLELDPSLTRESVDCGIGPAELAHRLGTGGLNFDSRRPLFVAVDDTTADEVLPTLSRSFDIVTTRDLVSPNPPLSLDEMALLDATIAEGAVAFAGQFISPLSFWVKERRATSGEMEENHVGSEDADTPLRPRASYYFDRANMHSCGVTDADDTRDSGPCAEERLLWMSVR